MAKITYRAKKKHICSDLKVSLGGRIINCVEVALF